MENSKIRIDKYLWAIRIFKTRSAAVSACSEGKIKYMGETTVKPSRVVQIGEEYRIRKDGKRIDIKVQKIIDKRVSAQLAAECFIDITPPEEKEKEKLISAFYFNSGKRNNKQARPTKKDRRKISALRGDL